MSYTQAEVELLKGCLKEICDEHFFSELHELRKRLAASNAKQQDLETKVKRYEEDIERLKACHSCHELMKTFSDACTQTPTPKPGASAEAVPVIPAKPNAKENGFITDHHMQLDDSPPKPAEPAKPAVPDALPASAPPASPKDESQPMPSTSKNIPVEQEVICISDSDDDI